MIKNIQSRLTPISPEYPSCDECYASLLIYTGNTHPNEISLYLDLEPTSINIKGWIITPSGKKRYAKNSFWMLSTENLVNSKDIREHLDLLLYKLKPKSLNIANLQTLEDISMGIDCIWRSLNWHGGPTLWPEQMKAMAELGLECAFDIYFVGDENNWFIHSAI
ncbi:DUF4279 domain-containing protein [Escherichia albertii]|uniref:DUF4279 domain-containing protein n=1 Tax=Escherichia albertii TaxID=208962 RepID=UPI002361DB17|nr:DUF4279 domain-containing protein [Escherichia albertii]WDB73392.1 DUF4279 domain-containing protein [Escherichia albertii]